MERLDKVIVGAQFHRLHCTVDHVVGAHHEDDGRVIGLLHAAQHFHAIDPGQHDIEQRQIRLLFSEYFERVFPRRRRKNFKPLLPQPTRNRAQREIFVIDDQDRIGHMKIRL